MPSKDKDKDASDREVQKIKNLLGSFETPRDGKPWVPAK